MEPMRIPLGLNLAGLLRIAERDQLVAGQLRAAMVLMAQERVLLSVGLELVVTALPRKREDAA